MKVGDTVKTVYAGKVVDAAVTVVSEKSIDVRITANDGHTFIRTGLVEANANEVMHEGQWRAS